MADEFNHSEWERYAKLSKQLLRTPGSTSSTIRNFYRYTKEDILGYLENPERNEQALRNTSIYLYNISSHYRRLINYFAQMPTYDFYLTPVKVNNTTKLNEKSFRTCYQKAVDQVELMNLKHELLKVAVTCFREDVFFGYEHETKDSYFIQQLNPDYCRLVAIEDGVYTFEFNFAYFDSNKSYLELYPSEFQTKYQAYLQNRTNLKWQEIDSSKSICIKLNEDLTYQIPPFVGTFPDIYDIADYKELMKAKTEQENYKLVHMKLPYDKTFKIPLEIANSFYDQVGSQLPEQIGLAMTPFDWDEVDFESSGSTQDTDSVAQSEATFWSASGASSSILGNSNVTSSSAIRLSIETDAAIVYGLLRQIERWINKKLKQLSGTYHFKLTFLNTTIYNRKEVQAQMMSACQYSFPARSMTAAAYGLTPSDLDAMLILENQILGLDSRMVPVSSTHTQTSAGNSSAAGRPKQNTVDEAGEKTEENDANER